MIAEKILDLVELVPQNGFPCFGVVAAIVSDPCTWSLEEIDLLDQPHAIVFQPLDMQGQYIDLLSDWSRNFLLSRSIPLSLTEANSQGLCTRVYRAEKLSNRLCKLRRCHGNLDFSTIKLRRVVIRQHDVIVAEVYCDN